MHFLYICVATCLAFELVAADPRPSTITDRVYYFDDSCSDIKDDFWNEIKAFVSIGAANTGSVFLDPDTPEQKWFVSVFKQIDDENGNFISDSLNAIKPNLAPYASAADVVIYCDDDDRWQVATNEQVPGNEERGDDEKAWYDAENDFVHDSVGTGTKRRKPFCKEGAMGITYDQDKSGRHRNTITICGKTLSRAEFKGFYSLSPTVNLAGHGIDFFAMPTEVLLHEMAHTLVNPRDSPPSFQWRDVQVQTAIGIGSAYRWDGVKACTATQALINAESLAYYCVGAFIQDKDYVVGDNGWITQGTDGVKSFSVSDYILQPFQ